MIGLQSKSAHTREWNLSDGITVGLMPEYFDYCPINCDGYNIISAMPEYSDNCTIDRYKYHPIGSGVEVST